MKQAQRRALGHGLAAAAAAMPLAYAVVRAIEARVSPEQDPAAVISSEHSALLTRLTVTAFVTLLAAAGTVSLAGAMPAHAPRVVGALAMLGALAALAQAVVLP
jgi:hypothetical protein